MENNYVKFYHGISAVLPKYLEGANTTYKDALFFVTDSHEIYLNGSLYSGSSGSEYTSAQAWNDFGDAFCNIKKEESTDNGITYTFDTCRGTITNQEVTNVIYIPLVSESTLGLMSSEDKAKLNSIDVSKIALKSDLEGLTEDNLSDDLKDKINSGQPNIIEGITLNNVHVEPDSNKIVNIQIDDIVNDLVASEIGKVYKYIDTVNTEDLLPKNANIGDVYNIVTSAIYGNGANVAWNGTEWDALGGTFDTSQFNNTLANLQTQITTANNSASSALNLANTNKTNISTLDGRVTTLENTVIPGIQAQITNILKWETIE